MMTEMATSHAKAALKGELFDVWLKPFQSQRQFVYSVCEMSRAEGSKSL